MCVCVCVSGLTASSNRVSNYGHEIFLDFDQSQVGYVATPVLINFQINPQARTKSQGWVITNQSQVKIKNYQTNSAIKSSLYKVNIYHILVNSADK